MTAVSHTTKNFHCSFCNQTVYGEKKLFEIEDEAAIETFCEKCGHILKEHRIRKFHRLTIPCISVNSD
jgi:NAD-dependent SIR2 family protein deacetylase